MCVRVTTQTTATPAPDYNAISSSFVSVHPSPGACLQQRAKPVLGSRQDVFSFKFGTQVVVLHQQYHVWKCCLLYTSDAADE